MSQYTSIKEDVINKLKEHLLELQELFGIKNIGIFGSVSRGDDTPESDVDILYIFQKNRGNLLITLVSYFLPLIDFEEYFISKVHDKNANRESARILANRVPFPSLSHTLKSMLVAFAIARRNASPVVLLMA